jgi:amidohydrolase
MDFSSLKNWITEEKRAEILRWRRELHRHPEMGLELPFTRNFLSAELDRMGLGGVYRLLDGGIVVDIAGTAGEGSRAVALRVDMDALPLTERTGVPYASSIEGYMHACGHDAHTAIGLGIAGVLQELKSRWRGSVRILFQAGEETLEGARLMVEQGALVSPGVDALIGLHLDPGFPLLSVALKPGQINAWVDEFSLVVKGKSSHGAAPHLSRDPVTAACYAVQAFQTIVSRNVPPIEAAVISIGKIAGGNIYNIIPDQVTMRGTVRCLSSKMRELIISRMKSIMSGIDESFGVRTELVFSSVSPPVICDEGLTHECFAILNEVLGENRVLHIPHPKMGGDDFAFYAQEVPAVLIRLGCASDACANPLHSSGFNFDEEVMPFGVSLFSYLLIHLLEKNIRKAGKKKSDA